DDRLALPLVVLDHEQALHAAVDEARHLGEGRVERLGRDRLLEERDRTGAASALAASVRARAGDDVDGDVACVRMALELRQDRPAVHDRKLQDRKSTRLNSSHRTISYAVFCLKKK